MLFQLFNSNIGYFCMCYLRPYHPVVIAVIDVLRFDKHDCRYFEVNVHGQFGGIVYYQEIQPLTFDCHAMYLPEVRGFSKEIGLAFWRYILTNTTVQCVTSFAARKFRHGQMYCAMIGLKRVGTIKKYFKGVDDVTFYSATREELIDFLNHGR